MIDPYPYYNPPLVFEWSGLWTGTYIRVFPDYHVGGDYNNPFQFGFELVAQGACTPPYLLPDGRIGQGFAREQFTYNCYAREYVYVPVTIPPDPYQSYEDWAAQTAWNINTGENYSLSSTVVSPASPWQQGPYLGSGEFYWCVINHQFTCDHITPLGWSDYFGGYGFEYYYTFTTQQVVHTWFYSPIQEIPQVRVPSILPIVIPLLGLAILASMGAAVSVSSTTAVGRRSKKNS